MAGRTYCRDERMKLIFWPLSINGGQEEQIGRFSGIVANKQIVVSAHKQDAHTLSLSALLSAPK